MNTLNKAMILGRLGRDPEVRYTSGGSPIANISVATNSRSKDKESGQWQDVTEWHRVILFNKNADNKIRDFCNSTSFLLTFFLINFFKFLLIDFDMGFSIFFINFPHLINSLFLICLDVFFF